VGIRGRIFRQFQGYYTGPDFVEGAKMKTDELEHLLHKILEKISNPDGNVELAKAYVKKDLALRQRQRENQKDAQESSFHLDYGR
jgi:hypothetical protein